jgi:hypothetical protein
MANALVAVFLGILATAAILLIPTLVIWFLHRDKCLHTFEKVACNEKYVVLVCERCGKVKKVRM